MKSQLICTGAGRYIQGDNAIGELGTECSQYGTKALVVADKIVWEKFAEEVEKKLSEHNVSLYHMEYAGDCSERNWTNGKRLGTENNCDFVLGIGGGRSLDTSKAIADQLGAPLVLFPTVAATCVPMIYFCVSYNEKGELLGHYFPKSPPNSTIVDTSVLALYSPLRATKAGMLDAMAKYPEIMYNKQYEKLWVNNIVTEVSYNIGRDVYYYLLEHGEAALENIKNGNVTKDVEDLFYATINLTGTTSGLTCGGKQAAVAHCFYAYTSIYKKQIYSKYYHGELVGALLPYQLALGGGTQQEVKKLVEFMNRLSMPVGVKGLGIDTTQAGLDDFLAFCQKKMEINSQTMGLLYKHINLLKG